MPNMLKNDCGLLVRSCALPKNSATPGPYLRASVPAANHAYKEAAAFFKEAGV